MKIILDLKQLGLLLEKVDSILLAQCGMSVYWSYGYPLNFFPTKVHSAAFILSNKITKTVLQTYQQLKLQFGYYPAISAKQVEQP